MKAYSEDLRRKIVQAVGGGMGKKARWREPWVSASLRSNVTSVWHTKGGLSLRRSLPACARRSMSKARGSSKRTSKSDRPLPSRNAESSCSAWREYELATRRFTRAIKRLGWSRKKDRWVPPNATNGSGRPGE